MSPLRSSAPSDRAREGVRRTRAADRDARIRAQRADAVGGVEEPLRAHRPEHHELWRQLCGRGGEIAHRRLRSDTLYLGFGVEGIAGPDARAEVLGRGVRYLLR